MEVNDDGIFGKAIYPSFERTKPGYFPLPGFEAV
jgi:hypothetical protein